MLIPDLLVLLTILLVFGIITNRLSLTKILTMQNELTPRQQASELIRQATNILIITGREPNNDQLSAVVALQRILTRLEKQTNVVISDRLPKGAELFDTKFVSRDLDGIRDFIIDVNMHNTAVDKLKYNVENDHLRVTVTPLNGNFKASDVSFDQGAYKFDLVIVVGVAQITKMDRIVTENPTIFDGLHLINIDYHRINENYGSVNVVDTNASSVCEILVSLIESLEQGMIDETVATALMCGIMSATSNFTTPSTTPKAMTIAAQMLSGGAKQQEIVKVLYAKGERGESKPVQSEEKGVSMKEAMEKALAESKSESKPSDEEPKKLDAKPSKKKSKSGVKESIKTAPSNPETSPVESDQDLLGNMLSSPESPLDQDKSE